MGRGSVSRLGAASLESLENVAQAKSLLVLPWGCSRRIIGASGRGRTFLCSVVCKTLTVVWDD